MLNYTVRSLYPIEQHPGMLSLLAGKPNPSTLPITSLSFSVRSPNSWLDSEETKIDIRNAELTESLQYAPTSGIPSLRKWIGDLMTQVHGRSAGEGWRVSLGSGSQDLLYRAFLALINPGDTILVEAPTYA
jgi:tryptophan aminotransferase